CRYRDAHRNHRGADPHHDRQHTDPGGRKTEQQQATQGNQDQAEHRQHHGEPASPWKHRGKQPEPVVHRGKRLLPRSHHCWIPYWVLPTTRVRCGHLPERAPETTARDAADAGPKPHYSRTPPAVRRPTVLPRANRSPPPQPVAAPPAGPVAAQVARWSRWSSPPYQGPPGRPCRRRVGPRAVTSPRPFPPPAVDVVAP